MKHLEIVQGHERFVPTYNMALAQRMHGHLDESEREITLAFELVNSRQDYESISLCLGQLAILNFLKKDFVTSQCYFQRCLAIAKDLDAGRMKLDCMLCLAFIAFE
jgi:hypothetical protein